MSIDRRFGPAPEGHDVAVVHGTLPVTPAMHQRVPVFEGGAEPRYGSLCQNESLLTTRAVSCLHESRPPAGTRT